MRPLKQIGSGVVQTIAYHCLTFYTLTQQCTVKHDKYCLGRAQRSLLGLDS
jgi:hypothetical protein